MQRVLNRYVLAECLLPLLLSLGIFSFVLLMQRLLMLSDLVVAKGVALGEVVWLLILALPGLMPLLLPVSLLLAVLLAMGRLSGDSEIVAMRACGVGLTQNLVPVMVLSLAVCALTAATSLWVQPIAIRSFRQVVYQSIKNRISVTTQTGVFTEITHGVTVYAGKIDDRSGMMENLFLCLDRGTTRGVWILARSGRLGEESGALSLDLRDGEIHQYGGQGSPYRLLRFEKYRLRIPLPSSDWTADVEEQPTRALLARAYGGDEDRDARLELNRRLALPASCLVFGLLGASLGLHHFRGGRSWGVSVCLAVLLVFYALFTVGRTLGRRGVISPELAMWMPNLALGALALYAYARKSREAPLFFEEAVIAIAARARRRLHGERQKP